MHSPSMLTALLADELIADHTQAAREHRAARRPGAARFPRLRRRRPGGAPPSLVPRGRTSPPFAH